MPKWRVFAHCDTVETIVVEAETEEEARERVFAGEGDVINSEWIGRTGDSNDWDVEPDE